MDVTIKQQKRILLSKSKMPKRESHLKLTWTPWTNLGLTIPLSTVMTDIASIPTTTASTTDILNSANSLLTSHRELLTSVRNSQRAHRRQLRALTTAPNDLVNLPLIESPAPSPLHSPPSSPQLASRTRPQRQDLHPAKRARVARYANYVPEEETIRNDYSQRYVDSGEWPQNRVLGAEPSRRFEECVPYLQFRI